MDLDLQRRLDRLEAHHRRLVRAYLATLLVASSAVLAALAHQEKPTESLSASNFKVLDKDGQLRAVFGATDKGTGLWIRDEKGNEQVRLLVPKDRPPYLNLYGKDRSNMVVVSLMGDDSPVISLFTKDKECSAGLMLSKDGAPGLIMKSKGASANLVVSEEGAPSLTLTSKGEKSGAVLEVTKEGAAHVWMRTQGKNPNASLGIADDGSCGVELVDSKGVLRATMRLAEDGSPEYMIRNRDGKPIWTTKDESLPK